MKKTLTFALLLLLSLSLSCKNEEQKQELPKAKNVIYMIGDGMALPQVFATMLATGGDLAFQQFPYIGVVDTRSASNDITDSAAGGTALACDSKTKNGMVGMDVDTLAMESILDVMADLGKSTGIVVTCYSGHATPADFYAKVPKRSMYEDIAVQFAESDKVNVMIAGGRKHFDHRKDSVNLIERMESELGWKVYDTLADIDTSCMKFSPDSPTGTALIFVADDGENCIAVAPGANRELLPEDIDAAAQTLGKAQFLLMQLEIPLETVYHAVDLAYEKGAVKRAESLVVAAVKDYPDCKKKAQGVFPEINLDEAVKAAESADGDL